jgi:hypothetical protein
MEMVFLTDLKCDALAERIGHLDGRLAIHHLKTNLIKSVEAALYPYIRIPMVEFTHTALFL